MAVVDRWAGAHVVGRVGQSTAEVVDTLTDPSCGLVLSIVDQSGATVVDGLQAAAVRSEA